MSDDPKTPVTGYKNAAARVLPGTDQIAAAIRNRAINFLPKMFQDLFETLEELGKYDEHYRREAQNIKWAASRVNIDTREW